MKLTDRRQTCWCTHRYRDHATGGTACLAVTDDPDDKRRTGFCYCQRWEPRVGKGRPRRLDAPDLALGDYLRVTKVGVNEDGSVEYVLEKFDPFQSAVAKPTQTVTYSGHKL